MEKIYACLLIVCLMMISAVACGASGSGDEEGKDGSLTAAQRLERFRDCGIDGFIRAEGQFLLDGNGNPWQIKGMALGNFVYDNNPAIPIGHHDEETYGELKELGFNSVRLYLNYGLFEDDSEPYVYKQEAWDWLDQNIEWAGKQGMRLVLNMHYPQGGYQSQGYGMQLWQDEECQKRLTALWKEIARRYQDEPVIIGYGLVNEPIVPKLDTVEASIAQWENLANTLTAAIREVDSNHVLFVERLIALKDVETDTREWNTSFNGQQNFIRVDDDNVAYEFHFYNPFCFTHQNDELVATYGMVRNYPDEEGVVAYYNTEWKALSEGNQRPILRNPDWQYLEGRKIKVTDESCNLGAVTLRGCYLGATGKVYYDDLTVTEFDENDQFVRVIYSLNFDGNNALAFWAEDGAGTGVYTPEGGREGGGCLYIEGTSAEANLTDWNNPILLKQGYSYQIDGWVKVESADIGANISLSVDFWNAETVEPLNKEGLENEFLRYLQFGQENNVPLYLGEFGAISGAFADGHGGERWVGDMIDLCNQYGVGFNYHAYHEERFGLWGNSAGAARSNRNEALADVFRQKLSPGQSQEESENDGGEVPMTATEEKIGNSVIKVYGDGPVRDGYRTVLFEETEALCADNPGQGWVILEEPLYGGLPSLGYKGTFPEVKNVSLSTGWSCVEREPGVLDWSIMDETIEYWVKQGKMINMRLCTDGLELNQSVVNGCPAWLFEEPYNVPKVVNDGQIYADLSSKVYQRELKRFLLEFAGHYMAEDYPYRDAIDVVELRGYGMVGEWHSGWYTFKTVEERTEALCDIIDAWREAWGDKLLVISCTYEFLNTMGPLCNAPNYEEFMRYMGYDHVLELDNISFRRDGIAFALRKYDSRMALDYFYMNTGLPLLGEIGDGYAKHTDSDPYPLFEAMNEALHKWRVNYQTVIGWVAQDFDIVVQQETELVDYFNRMMGFRLVPDRIRYSAEVKAGDWLYLDSLWTNKAMGRCWTDYDLSVYLEDEAGNTVYTGTDPRFCPVAVNGGEAHFFDLRYELPAELPDGEYLLKFAVSDGQGNPCIELPIAGGEGMKYYLGKVTVGGKAAADPFAQDADPLFTACGEGAISESQEAGDVLTGEDSAQVITGGGTGVFALGPKLENGKTYYLSFDYRTHKPKEEIHITDESRYLAGVYCAAEDSWGDSYGWLDVSNQDAHRSVVLTVPEDGREYAAAFGGLEEVAPITISGIRLQEAQAIPVEFEEDPEHVNLMESGDYSVFQLSEQGGWGDGLRLKNRLEPHSTYMLTFDAKTSIEISNGGFFYVTLRDSRVDWEDKYASVESFSLNRIGSFWMPDDRGYAKYSYVFNTGDYGKDWDLVFGVRKQGGFLMNNITLIKLDGDCSYGADPQPIAHNVLPDKGIDVDHKGLVENFEGGAFNGTCMYPGAYNLAILRPGENVISGNASCYVYNFRENKPYFECNRFCMTNAADMLLSPNTSYRVRFKFKILQDVGEDGKFFCCARNRENYEDTPGYFEWNGSAGSSYEEGKVYSVEYEFTTGEGNYSFEWAICHKGGLAIDDVTFDKVERAVNTEPLVTEGHAYTITEEVLYQR